MKTERLAGMAVFAAALLVRALHLHPEGANQHLAALNALADPLR